MELALEQITKQDEELQNLNQQLKMRAQKFGAQFTPLTMTDFKLFKIRKARETGNIGYLSNILLEEIQDLQQRKDKIKERIQNFYPELKVQSEDKFFEQRQTPVLEGGAIQLRQNAWNLFGVDYMSNELIRNYFHINPHFKIQWVNDSSCNLIFNSPQEANQAIRPMIKGQGMQDESELWFQLPEYEVQTIKRKLYCRTATIQDVKKRQCHGHKSQYYAWMINKDKMNKYVKHKAHTEIIKTKGINREDRYHRQHKDAQVKREKKEKEEESSSGVQDSQEMAD